MALSIPVRGTALTVGAVVATAGAAAAGQPAWMGLGLGALVGPWLLRNLHWIVNILCVWIPIQYWLTKDLGLLPRAAVWLDELLVVVLGLGLVIRQLQSGDVIRRTAIDRPLAAFVAIGVISALANSVRPEIALLGLRDTLQYVVVFYAITWLPASREQDRRWLRILLGIALVQAPITIVQAAVLFRTAGDRLLDGDYDMTVGTFGPSGGDFVAYFILFFLLLMIARTRDGLRVPAWIVPALLIPFVASTSRLCFMFLPIGVAWLFRRQILSNPRRLVGPALLTVAAFGALALYYRNDPEIMRMVLDPRTIITSQFNFDLHYVGRAVHYPVAWMMLREMAVSPWLGLGPGMYVGPTAHFFMVPATQFVYDLFQVAPETRRFGSVDSGFLPIVGSYGVLGSIAFAWLVWRLYRLGRWVERWGRDPIDRALGAGFAAVTIFAVFGCLGAPVFEVQVLAFTFWMLAGLTQRAVRRRDEETA